MPVDSSLKSFNSSFLQSGSLGSMDSIVSLNSDSEHDAEFRILSPKTRSAERKKTIMNAKNFHLKFNDFQPLDSATVGKSLELYIF